MQELVIVCQSIHTFPEMQITPCSSRCCEQIYILIAKEKWKNTQREMRENAKGEIRVGSGELKHLKNVVGEKKLIEPQLDCEFFEGVSASQLEAQYNLDMCWILDLNSSGEEEIHH